MDPQDSKYKRRDKIPRQIKKKWDEEQYFIRNKIIQTDQFAWDPKEVELIGGVDVSFSGKFENGACAGLLIYSVKRKKIIYEDYEYVKLTEQYIPGFLAFRELPPTLELFKRLKASHPELWPQVVLVDGNGILHKNRCGYASHLGVLLKTPTVGCAKTFFDVDGLHKTEVEEMLSKNLENQLEWMRIKGDSGKQWCAAVLIDVNQTKYMYISIGTMISLKTAANIVLDLCRFGGEGPEPVRLVDRISRRKIREMSEENYKNARSYEMVFLKDQ